VRQTKIRSFYADNLDKMSEKHRLHSLQNERRMSSAIKEKRITKAKAAENLQSETWINLSSWTKQTGCILS
jgi:hypothetical protein